MRKYGVGLAGLIIAASAVFGGGIGRAEGQANAARTGCRHLPSWGDLRAALVAARNEANGGLKFTCGARSSIATASCARWRSPATNAAISGPAAG